MVDQTQTHQKPQQDCSHPDSRCLPPRPESQNVIQSGNIKVDGISIRSRIKNH